MTASEDLANFAMDFVNSVKTRSLEWKREKLSEILELQKRREDATKELQGELKKKEALLRIELEKITTQGAAEVKMLEDKYKREVEDYKQFLDEVDKLKTRIQEVYPQMPSPMVLTIYRHAKRLLNSIYDADKADDIKGQILQEQKFIYFLEAVYRDTTAISSNLRSNQPALPSETIALINKQGSRL